MRKNYVVTLAVSIAALCICIIVYSPLSSGVIDNNDFLPSLQDPHDMLGFVELSQHFECQYPEWCDTYFNDSKIIQDELYTLQHPNNCNEAKFVVCPEEYVSGMGSSIHIKAFAIGIAVTLNRTFIMADNAAWVYGRRCDPPTAECYFEPLTHCNTALHAPNWENAPTLKNLYDHANERVVRLPYDWVPIQPPPFQWSSWVPPQYTKNIQWWHAQVTKYVTRPNARTKQIVAEEQRRVFPNGKIPHPIISMYVRHGDKWKEATLLNFSRYMDVVHNITNKVNIRDIYLGTDDPGVITEALEIQKQGVYRLYYINHERKNGAPLATMETKEAEELVRVSLADLFIQVQGDVFVGTRTSNWCRLIDEIRKVAGKARIPFFSPEAPELLFAE
jgi:hypothetical protein